VTGRALGGERRGGRAGGEGGQASIELLAGLPALLLAALVAAQLLITGWAATLADGAAEAGALARAAGHDPEAAVRAALPGWAGQDVGVEAREGWVTVRIRPPAAVPGLGGALEVDSRAWVRPPGDLTDRGSR